MAYPTTSTGYHRPIGSSPEEPTVNVGAGETEADRLTKPNHAGLLSDSIERAHARFRAAGSGSPVASVFPLGSLTANVSGVYSRATFSKGDTDVAKANSKLVFAVDGVYELDARVTPNTGAGGAVNGAWLEMWNSAETTSQTLDVRTQPSGSYSPVHLRSVVAVAAGSALVVRCNSTGTTLDILHVRRIGA